jgi:hypothetical protein
MRSPKKRPVTRVCLALTAALLGLATVTAVAVADPNAPPPTSSSKSPTETPSSESAAAPSSDTSSPAPSSELAEQTQEVSVDALYATASFDRAYYATGATMTITMRLENTTTVPIRTRASFLGDRPDSIEVTSGGGFEKGDWFTLDAGAIATHTFTGAAHTTVIRTAFLYMRFDGGQRVFTYPTLVTPGFVRVSGAVYHDRNLNGRFDAGEGLAGAEVRWGNELDWQFRPTTTTNTAGEFALDLPPGPYRVEGAAPEVDIATRHVDVPESGVDGVLLRGTMPLTDLAADMAFTKDTYGPDEAPVVRVTLTNKGNLPLTGIVATCVPSNGGPYLTGAGAGWGDLAGEGVTIPAHATKTLEVTEPMPAVAPNHGYVRFDCHVSFPGVDSGANPHVTGEAAVPGKTGEASAQVVNISGPEPAGWRIVVTARDGACPVRAQGTTDANGFVALGRLPVGIYRVYALPPTPDWWFRFVNTNVGQLSVVAGGDSSTTFLAYQTPGGSHEYTQPPNCPGSGGSGGVPPGPQSSASPGLAYTGASLLVPGIAGLLALLTGAGAVVLTRRRRTEIED